MKQGYIPKTPFNAWLVENNVSPAEMARAAGVRSSTVSDWLHKVSMPKVYHALLIESLTDGGVKPIGWLSTEDFWRFKKPGILIRRKSVRTIADSAPPLGTWLKENRVTLREFSKKVRVAESTALHWARGIRPPKLNYAIHIYFLTNNEVSLEDWLTEDQKKHIADSRGLLCKG